MKIVMVGINARYNHTNLAIRYIKSFCSEQDIEIFEGSINENEMNMAFTIAEKYPDVACFSCYIWNMENTLKVCSVLKKLLPGTKIILGGPEVSYDGEEVLKKYEYIDFVVEGEGETTCQELFYAIDLNIKDFKKIDGIVFRNGSKIVKNKERKPIEDLNIIPFPYEGNIPDKIIYYEASRGCPFNCSYCLSSTIKGVRHLEIGRVKKELKYFIDNNVKLVKFVDRTFNSNKDYAIEIWKYLIENCKNTKFHFEIEADILDDEEISVLNEAPVGLFQLEIGVQTTNLDILQNINRKMNFEKLKSNVEKILEKENIHCHLDLIAGLSGEDIKSFRNSFDMCMTIMPDMLQLGFLKILKGSPIFKNINEYEIEYMDYPPYQVLCTRDITFEDMNKLIGFEEIFEGYYNSRIMEFTMNILLKYVKSPFDFFEKFYFYMRSIYEYKRSMNLNEKYKMFLDYARDYLDSEILKDILLLDFVRVTKKSYIPEFLRREFPENIKEMVEKNIEHIEEVTGKLNFKCAFLAPVKFKVVKKGRDYFYEKKECILVYNLNTEKYVYI